MTWFASSANELEALKDRYAPFAAVDFDFPSGHYRFWTGIGEIILNGNTYIGAGQIAKIESENETTELAAQRKKYSLSGVDPSTVDEDDIDNSFGRSVVEYLGFVNPDSRLLVAATEIIWEGRIDSFRRVDGSAPLIEVTAEHRLAMLDRSDDWRWTHEHQQQFYAGDLGFNLVPTLALKKVMWSGKAVDPAIRNPAGSPRPPRRGGQLPN